MPCHQHPMQEDSYDVRMRTIVALLLHELLDAIEACGDETATPATHASLKGAPCTPMTGASRSTCS
jgi:hypothetical protein